MVENGKDSWQWAGGVGAALPGRAAVNRYPQSGLTAQARREIRGVLDIERAWLANGQVSPVEERDGLVLAEVTGKADAEGKPAWVSRLRFKRTPQGLLVVQRETQRPDRYWIATFEDYRPVDGRMVAHRRTLRSGPGQARSAETPAAEYFHEYVIRKIKFGLAPEETGLFDPPEGAFAPSPSMEGTKLTHGEITRTGRNAFTP